MAYKNTNTKKCNVYEMVTNRIIDQLSKGDIPWHKPWHGINSGAYNRVSKKPYSLMNQMLLSHDGEYATYKQWHDMGGQVRKGEKAEIVVFWKMIDVKEEKDGETNKKKVPMLRYYSVFHVSQVDGVEPLDRGDAVEHEPIAEAEKIKNDYMEREGIEIKEIFSNDAFYSPMGDFINIPAKEQYDDVAEFYATLFHEVVHSSGSETRLNRFSKNEKLAKFGSEDYSKEELVAELGSAFLMNSVGIETPDTFKNSAAYIQSWLNVLKNDPKMIVSAAGKAEKAAEFILTGKKPSYMNDNNKAAA